MTRSRTLSITTPPALVRGQRVDGALRRVCRRKQEVVVLVVRSLEALSLGQLLLPGSEALRLCRAVGEQPLALA
jgi:hypothetical protein